MAARERRILRSVDGTYVGGPIEDCFEIRSLVLCTIVHAKATYANVSRCVVQQLLLEAGDSIKDFDRTRYEYLGFVGDTCERHFGDSSYAASGISDTLEDLKQFVEDARLG